MPVPHIVALGGGHGLYTSLRALRPVTDALTAIVTVADDGGSSGRLRKEFGIVPPGDLRMALSALCEDTEWGTTWRDVLQTRFVSEGDLHGHAVGNLLIAGLWEHTGDVVGGLDWVARLLRAQGRVLPVCDEAVTISARVEDAAGVRIVTGQAAVATSHARILDLTLTPATPHVPLATLDAIASADIVVLGPGSWYTSVLTHFLVPDVRAALVAASPRAVLTLNIANADAETHGMDRADDVEALRTLAPEFRPAVVLADATEVADGRLARAVEDWGATLVVAPLRAASAIDRHDEAALAREYRNVVDLMTASGSPASR